MFSTPQILGPEASRRSALVPLRLAGAMVAALALLAAAGCGQKGGLYLDPLATPRPLPVTPQQPTNPTVPTPAAVASATVR